MKSVTSMYFRFAFFLVSALFACMSLLVAPSFAQDKRYTENGPDLRLRSEARVDPSTLGMSVEIPLGGAPGRAGTNASSVLRYQSKQWRMKYGGGWRTYTSYHTKAFPLYSENAAAGWTSSLDVPWIEYTGRDQRYDEYGFPLSDDPQVENDEACFILRIHLHMPDGSSHELRQSDTPQCIYVYLDPLPTFAGTFYSTDGSRMRFDADAGVLYLPDGGRYLFGAEQTRSFYNTVDKTARWATQYIDRNGNTLNYSFSGVTDSMGRTYNNPLADNPTVRDQIYTVPGFGGQNITYTLRWKDLADVLTAGTLSYTSNYKCLAPNQYQAVSPYLYTTSSFTHICAGNVVFNPVVLAEVELPNGQLYQFKYNVYGEIDGITYPTGGYERFRYDHISPLGDRNVYYGQANRGVVERWVSAKGDGTDETHWTYAADYADQYGSGPYKATMTTPDGTRTDRLLKYAGGISSFGFDNLLGGMAYDEGVYNSTNQMLRRSLTEWQVSGPQQGGSSAATRDPRVTRSVNLILDTGGNALSTSTTMQYDADLNVISTNHYDYASVDSTTAQTGAISSISLGTLARTEETTYLVNDTDIDSGVRQSYRNRQLLGLPTSSRIKNASGTVVAQSSISYDEASYPLLTYGGVTGWTDPQTSYRGNPTTVSPWLNTTGSYLPSHIQYDQCGSVRNTWDARGNQSQVEYSSSYAYAYPTLTRTPVPDSSGQNGSSTALVSTSVYDYNTGLVTSVTDPNNVTTTFEYNDYFNHPTRTVRASGTGVQNQTSVAYDYLNHLITTTTDQNSYNDGALKSQMLYDGLGRTTESRQYEGGTNYIVVQTQYDTMGRAFKTSNPFRPWQSETAVWTTTAFDALSRVLTVTTPDSAVVTSAYSGSTSSPVGTVVTVTDQAGKARQSITDGLGRLTTVYEDPASLNYSTSYSYDTLNNLTTVTQGSQTRTFVYDSLKRLTSAWNPESGTVSYVYDSNGNLTSKTDARTPQVTATFVYDALNRVITRSYSNDGGLTPPVSYYYDNASLPSGAPASFNRGYASGRLVAVTYGSSSSAGDYYGFDALGRQTVKIQQTGGINYQVGAVYNLAGALTAETYPSGHTVSYAYDSAGRTNGFTGDLGDGTQRTYSTGIIYSPFGGMSKEQFGTTTPIYNKLFYNSRGQLSEIRESTSYTGPTDTTWDRGAIINHYSNTCWGMCSGQSMTDNNGNLKKQDVDIPGGALFSQFYSYDSLNRLQSVREDGPPGPANWQQQYIYDRFGNRTIDQANTWGSLIPKPNFGVDTATNRLTAPAGYTMSYDAAGNLTNDTFTGEGTRTYDAENRMKQAWSNSQWQTYTYDGDGRRVKRNVNGTETWQIYGLGGELLAEYAANAAPASPQKEYGYRNGQLLVTADAASGGSGSGPQNVTWTNAVGVSVSGNNLTKTAAEGWGNSGASSTQSIASGDGYVEFTAGETSTYRMIGLSHGDTDQGYGDIDFAIFPIVGGGIQVYEGGYYRGGFGTFATGDTLRVAVEGGVVKYKKNGTVLYTSTVAPTYPLLADASLYTNGSTITNAVISTGASGGGGGGGTQNASFTNAVGVTVSGNNLTKTGADGWSSGASSTQSIASGDGYVEFTAGETSTYRMIGLSHGDTDQGYGDIDFAIFPIVGGGLQVYEGGYYRGGFGTFATGDTLRVAVEGGVVKYKKNGTVLYTSTVAPTYPLLVDSALYSSGSTLTNVVISSGGGGGGGTQNASFTNAVAVTVSGNNLTKTGADGWSSGASSTQSIASGDGYVEFTAGETSTYRMIGLSHGDTDQGYGDIDFAIFPIVGGGIQVYEGGYYRGSFGTFATGDILRVAVEGGVVKYRKNGTLLYTSTVAPAYPLLVDTSLYSNGSTLTNVVISSGSGGGGSSSAQIHWLVTDQLGTPRMIFDQTGSLANVSRHDYLPFGEEIGQGVGGRTQPQGYTNSDGARQKFTLKERDIETGLDYSINRYYSSTQGRFTSPDPTLMSIDPANPQTLNRYTYALNNPLAFIDPDGLEAVIVGNYNDLTEEQKRLFQTYVNKNYADQIGDMNPTDFAQRLWNESALVANTEGADASVLGSSILTQSQLTTFLGVTNMLESRGVSGEVASITSINGDISEHEFRLIGELKNNSTSVEAIDKAFSHDIAGKGHSPYDISKREQGFFGQPNGQVSRIPKGAGVDVDVDYRALRRLIDHNKRENSDIRADDGNTSHYRRNVERYGPIRALTPVNPTFVRQR